MDGANGDVGILGVDDAGNRTRAFALGDGEDRNTDRSEGSEESSCDVFFGRMMPSPTRESKVTGATISKGSASWRRRSALSSASRTRTASARRSCWEDDSDGLAVGGLCGHPEGISAWRRA